MVFVAELGDKTQLLMVAMASKYKIRDILMGTGAAICLLNIMAIAVGALLGGVLPVSFISVVAGFAFLTFAYSSICDGAGEEEELSGAAKGGIFSVFGTFFLAELGDKTQLTALTLAAEHSSGGADISSLAALFFGSSIALFAADVIGLAVGYFLGKAIPSGVFGWLSFAIFSAFGVLKLISGFEGAFSSCAEPKLLSAALTSLVCIFFAALIVIKLIKKRKIKV